MNRNMVSDNLGFAIAESFRKVAANIEFANIDNRIKTIMITSSISGEGKTTTVCNLAGIMAETKDKILLIDLDLRKPNVHKQFNLSNKKGLSELLLNKDSYKNYINNVYYGLDVITSGCIPSNPFEIINSKAIKELIKNISVDYNYVFLDTPPVALVSDPITISTFSDAVILIISNGETEKEVAKKTIDSLKHVNANIIGTIFNKVDLVKHKKYNYKYYKY